MKRPWRLALTTLATLAFILAACRPPFPPATGSGSVYFEEAPTVHVTVRDCIHAATYTVALREAIEAAHPKGSLVMIFHQGPSRYLGISGGRGYAFVRCEDWGSVAGIIREHNREMAGP